MDPVNRYIDDNQEKIWENQEIIDKSMSPLAVGDMTREMVKILEERLKALGATVEDEEADEVHKFCCFSWATSRFKHLPPFLKAKLGDDPTKKTLLVVSYPVWNCATMLWIDAVEAFQKSGQKIPVNLVFLFVGSGRDMDLSNIPKLLRRFLGHDFKKFDFACIGASVMNEGYNVQAVQAVRMEVYGETQNKDFSSSYLRSILLEEEFKKALDEITDVVILPKKATGAIMKIYATEMKAIVCYLKHLVPSA